jgi:gamma-glutamylcyclotransferase (GGCT)/AIG2-like uncharacterized protein YtfP
VDLFVYGTLTEPDRVATLCDAFSFLGGARVDGLAVAAGASPTLVPGDAAAGRLLRVDDAALAALDRHEGVAAGTHVRVGLARTDGGSVETYVGDPAALGVADGWPGDGPLADRVRAYCDEAGVAVRPTG